jgi:hypothetical protein
MILEEISHEKGLDIKTVSTVHRINVRGFRTKARCTKDHIQIHAGFDEPVSKEKLARAFEMLAAKVREVF